MTIIAYKNGLIAADTQLTSTSGLKVGFTTKIGRNPKGDLIGASGSSAWLWAMLQWFTKGEKGNPPKYDYADADREDQAMIVRQKDRDRVWLMLSKHKLSAEPILFNGCGGFAVGSGRSEAMGAMFAGGDAITAVKAAINLDDGCGGDIHAFGHSGPPRIIKQ